ncbi:MAG: hypothetical protein QM811_05405 [Pirellulales bacterium]
MPEPVDQPSIALEAAQWLAGEVGRGTIERVVSELHAGKPRLRVIESIRTSLNAQQAQAVLDQVGLREKIREKFPFPQPPLATQKGLEQATDWAIARYKTARLATAVGRESTVVDIGCGIGGDLLGMLAAGFQHVIGYERDPVTAVFAQANAARMLSDLAAIPPDSTVRIEAFAADPAAIPPNALWHMDPDRRPGGGRAVDWEWLAPGPEFFERLLASHPTGVLKGAPAAPALPGRLADLPQTREWIASRRECRQQVVWFGRAADAPGSRRATVVRAADDWEAAPFAESFTGLPDQAVERCDEWAAYLHEPSAALLAAELDGAFAREQSYLQIQPGLPYYTSDRSATSALASSFRIELVTPWRKDRVKALLHERNIGRLEIKKRGVELDPETVRKELKLKGDNAATLFLTRRGEQRIAILAHRIVQDSADRS